MTDQVNNVIYELDNGNYNNKVALNNANRNISEKGKVILQ